MKPNQYLLVFILFLGVVACKAQIEDLKSEKDVYILTKNNFDSFVQTHDQVLILFYAPWDDKSTDFIPEFEKVAKTLKQDNIFLAKVDAQIENNLIQKYHVEKFPSIKLFMLKTGKENQIVDFGGMLNQDFLIQWAQERLMFYQTLAQITKSSFLKETIKKYDSVIVFFKKNGKNTDEDYLIFKQISQEMQDQVIFAYCFEQDVLNEYKIEGEQAVIVAFRDREQYTFSEEYTYKKLVQFIENNSESIVMRFNERVAEKIFGEEESNVLALILFVSETKATAKEKCEEAIEEFINFAPAIKDRIKTVIANIDQELSFQLFQFLGSVTEGDMPTLILVKASGERLEKYKFDQKKVEQESIKQFVDDFYHKKLEPYFKSKPVPEETDAPLKEIVALSFKHIVYNEIKDVMVLFYAEWCTHCHEFLPIFEEFANDVAKTHKNTIIAKFSVVDNDFDEIEIGSLPTVKFWRAGKKNDPLEFDGERSVEHLKQFLEKYGTHPVASINKEDL